MFEIFAYTVSCDVKGIITVEIDVTIDVPGMV